MNGSSTSSRWRRAAAITALNELSSGELQRGLVPEDGRLEGVVSITDIARVLAMPPRRARRF